MKKIDYKTIFLKTILYRVLVISIQTIFTYYYIKFLGKINYSGAFQMSVIWNIINIILYFFFEIWSSKKINRV